MGKGYHDEGSHVGDNGPFCPVKNVGDVLYGKGKERPAVILSNPVQFHLEVASLIEER